MPQESRRILILTTAYSPFIGGSEIAIDDVTGAISEFFFEIVTPRIKPHLLTTESNGHRTIHRVGFGSMIDKFLFPLTGFLKASALIRRYRINTIHAYQASYGGGVGYLIKLFNPGIKFIVTLQEGKNLSKQSFFIRFFRSLILRRADLITAISNYLCAYALKVAPMRQCVVIPNGVNLDKLTISHSASESGRYIVSLSRLVPKNGLKDLIEAFHILNAKHIILDVSLIIIGEGPERKSLEARIRSLGLELKVKLLGALPREKALQYVAGSWIFVRPALSEGLGTAFLEAIALKVPVIGTPVGGILDFIKNGETGLFCQPSQPKDLADKIEILMKNENLRDRLIANAYDLIKREYSLKSVADKFRNIYLSYEY